MSTHPQGQDQYDDGYNQHGQDPYYQDQGYYDQNGYSQQGDGYYDRT